MLDDEAQEGSSLPRMFEYAQKDIEKAIKLFGGDLNYCYAVYISQKLRLIIINQRKSQYKPYEEHTKQLSEDEQDADKAIKELKK